MIEQQRDDLRYLQFSHYLQFPDLIHGVFTRLGGCSQAPYQSLNTSTSPLKPGDSIDNVIRNRQLVLHALELSAYPCVTLWQVHSADVVTFDAKHEWRTDWADHSFYQQWTPQALLKADAIITKERGIALSLSFADCTPIMFYDPIEQVIGIAHGGWRGTARGIAVATIESMHTQFGCQPHNIYAGIGPAIGPCCYEVSDTVQHLFMGDIAFDDMPTQEQYCALVRETAVFSTVSQPDKTSLRLDLCATNRNQLLIAGLFAEHIEVADTCTSCHTDRFFSYRAEHGQTGRFPVIIALSETHIPHS